MIMHLPPFITLVSWFLEVCYKVPSQWSCLGLSKKKSTTFWLMSTKGRYNTLLECDLSTKRKYACGRLKSPHDIHSMFCFLLFWMQRCTLFLFSSAFFSKQRIQLPYYTVYDRWMHTHIQHYSELLNSGKTNCTIRSTQKAFKQLRKKKFTYSKMWLRGSDGKSWNLSTSKPVQHWESNKKPINNHTHDYIKLLVIE